MIIVARIIMIIIGAAGGAIGFDFLVTTFIGGLPIQIHSLFIFLGIITGGGLGFVLGGVVGRAIQRLFHLIEKAITRIPGTDLLIGTAGLLVGLIISFLLSFGLNLIPYGEYISVVVFLILGILGFYVGLRKKEDIINMLRAGRGKAELEEPVPGGELAPKVVDTSAIIDGRIVDIVRAGFIEGTLILPRFVLDEIHAIADSPDTLRRNRGRRGLDILNALTKGKEIQVEFSERDFPDLVGVDSKLVQLAKEMKGTIITVDYNLNKVAKLQGVGVLNVNELANALKTLVLPGEEMKVKVVREGKEAGQGVAYLDDGTMIVVEEGKKFIGRDIKTVVTSVLQTPAGRMIFVRPKK